MVEFVAVAAFDLDFAFYQDAFKKKLLAG